MALVLYGGVALMCAEGLLNSGIYVQRVVQLVLLPFPGQYNYQTCLLLKIHGTISDSFNPPITLAALYQRV